MEPLTNMLKMLITLLRVKLVVNLTMETVTIVNINTNNTRSTKTVVKYLV